MEVEVVVGGGGEEVGGVGGAGEVFSSRTRLVTDTAEIVIVSWSDYTWTF